MRRLLWATALTLACSPPPAAEAPRPAADPWCVQLERWLSPRVGADAALSCDGVANTALDASASCVPVTKRALAPNGAAFTTTLPARLDGAPWLGEVAGAVSSTSPVTLTVELRDAQSLTLGDLASSLSKGCAKHGPRLCGEDPSVVESVVVAAPSLVFRATPAPSFEPTQELAKRVRAERSSNALRVTFTKPLTIAARSASAGALLGDGAVCQRFGGRAASREQIAAFRSVLVELGLAFLQTYQCQMIEMSAEMLNGLCDGAPCSPTRLFYDVYRKPLAELSEPQQQAICKSVDAHPALSSCGYATGFACKALQPWLERNGSLPWCRFGFGGCSEGILAGKHAPTQIELFRELFAHSLKDRSACMASAVLTSWKSYAPELFAQAEATWLKLLSSCLPAGCRFGRGVTSTDWNGVERFALVAFFDHFSKPGALTENPGCAAVSLRHDRSWTVHRDRSGYGMAPIAPEELRPPAERYASAVKL